MLLTAALASLLSAQPSLPPEQLALAQCLRQFVAAQQQAGTDVADLTNALATACYEEERTYRASYVTAAAQRGVRQLDADSEAYRNALSLRNAARDTYLAAQPTCRRGERDT